MIVMVNRNVLQGSRVLIVIVIAMLIVIVIGSLIVIVDSNRDSNPPTPPAC